MVYLNVDRILLNVAALINISSIPAGETLLDLLSSFELLAGDTAIGSLELILRRLSAGVSGTGVLEPLKFFSRDSLEALENTPCIALHYKKI